MTTPQADAPLLRLGTWPTPVEPAPRLAEHLGLGRDDLLLKRDDLCGLGGGGNKVRKLERTVGRALAEGADVLVTTGAAQSNHARATAAAARRAGLGCVLVLAGSAPGRAAGNLVLDELLGAQLEWVGDVALGDLDAAAEQVCARLRAEGSRPSRVPYGGSDALGVLGYVEAAAEIAAQVPDVAHVVTAVGSGGTMAGLVAGLGPARVLGVDVGAVPDPVERVVGLVRGVAAAQPDALPDAAAASTVRAGDLRLRRDEVGEGYGVPTPGSTAALEAAARTEGVVLDPVYTAKALAGLASAVRRGEVRPGGRTVLVHTGGLPGLFGHPSVTGA
ncbi:pyridoxal-phosphate dependent enzyme [Pseudokineococcus basanitobsidens]|uniref:Pyridoxal-phosphate dependent enzyme n=1 Tax=Pseudokineococcus basanitobsidens TaxID=1926649 RepID=A0ABU8RGA0_9ACTN